MPLLALRTFQHYLSKTYFCPWGVKCASYSWTILLSSLFCIFLLSYPVIHPFPPRVFVDGHLWLFSPHIYTTDSYSLKVQRSFIVKQIRIYHQNQTQLFTDSKSLYNHLNDFTAVVNKVTYSLQDICATAYPSKHCLFHSPFEEQTASYTLGAKKISPYTGLSFHPLSVLGNAAFDSRGHLSSFDSVILTFILKDTQHTLDIWNQLLHSVLQQANQSSSLIQRGLNLPNFVVQYKVSPCFKYLTNSNMLYSGCHV